jgi:transposase InsO family protein
MKVSKSNYYKAIKVQKTKKDSLCLVLHMKSIAKETGSTYGSLRMAKALQARGFTIGRHAARTLMKEAHIEALQRRRRRNSTQATKRLVTIENLLDRKFDVEAPNKAWVADITEIKSEEG